MAADTSDAALLSFLLRRRALPALAWLTDPTRVTRVRRRSAFGLDGFRSGFGGGLICTGTGTATELFAMASPEDAIAAASPLGLRGGDERRHGRFFFEVVAVERIDAASVSTRFGVRKLPPDAALLRVLVVVEAVVVVVVDWNCSAFILGGLELKLPNSEMRAEGDSTTVAMRGSSVLETVVRRSALDAWPFDEPAGRAGVVAARLCAEETLS